MTDYDRMLQDPDSIGFDCMLVDLPEEELEEVDDDE